MTRYVEQLRNEVRKLKGQLFSTQFERKSLSLDFLSFWGSLLSRIDPEIHEWEGTNNLEVKYNRGHDEGIIMINNREGLTGITCRSESSPREGGSEMGAQSLKINDGKLKRLIDK